MKTTRVDFRFPVDLHAKAKKHAKKKKVTLSDLVRDLLAKEVSHEGEQVKPGRPVKAREGEA